MSTCLTVFQSQTQAWWYFWLRGIIQQFLKKIRQLCKVYQMFLEISYQEFSCHVTFLPEVLEFTVEWLAFQNSTISGFSGNLPREFPCHLSLFWNFLNFWPNGKCPTVYVCPCSTAASHSQGRSRLVVASCNRNQSANNDEPSDLSDFLDWSKFTNERIFGSDNNYH